MHPVMKPFLSRLVFVLALGPTLLLAACETAPPAKPKMDISFTHLAPIALNVGRIEIVSQYRPTFAKPNVEHLFPVTPAAALERWASERLRARGSSGVARFIISDASVKETKLEQKSGLVGLVTIEQAERYDGAVRVRMEVVDANGRSGGTASAYATRYQTVSEGASLNERNRVWLDLVNDLMADFNGEMERNARQVLGNWLR